MEDTDWPPNINPSFVIESQILLKVTQCLAKKKFLVFLAGVCVVT